MLMVEKLHQFSSSSLCFFLFLFSQRDGIFLEDMSQNNLHKNSQYREQKHLDVGMWLDVELLMYVSWSAQHEDEGEARSPIPCPPSLLPICSALYPIQWSRKPWRRNLRKAESEMWCSQSRGAALFNSESIVHIWKGIRGGRETYHLMPPTFMWWGTTQNVEDGKRDDWGANSAIDFH